VLERFALPVCTTVVPPPPVADEAAPNAAPAAAPFATGWLFCCSSAGGGCCAGGGCWAGICSCAGGAGGGVCDDACGTIAVVTASAITHCMSVLKGFIRPPFRPLLFRAAMRPVRPLPPFIMMLPVVVRCLLGTHSTCYAEEIAAAALDAAIACKNIRSPRRHEAYGAVYRAIIRSVHRNTFPITKWHR
jgi:hypothetical protein